MNVDECYRVESPKSNRPTDGRLLLLCFSVTAFAQTERQLADLELEDLMKVEVQSVFGASKFLQKVTDAPAAVSVVTAHDIEIYGYRTLADIIRSAPGFNVTYDRNYTYVGVRGFQRPGDYNSRVLVLVDGHRTQRPYLQHGVSRHRIPDRCRAHRSGRADSRSELIDLRHQCISSR